MKTAVLDYYADGTFLGFIHPMRATGSIPLKEHPGGPNKPPEVFDWVVANEFRKAPTRAPRRLFRG